MTASVDALRDLISVETAVIEDLLQTQRDQQLGIVAAQAQLDSTAALLVRSQAKVAAYQATIDREENLPTGDPSPDSPTNIPEVPDPAEGEE